MLKIVNAPNTVLSQQAKPYIFKKGDKYLASLLKDMEEALLSAKDPKGVGLAAPQVGKSLSIFIAKPTAKSKILVFINPQIIEYEQTPSQKQAVKSQKRVKKLEGCLSLPSIWGEVLRSPNITLKYQTVSGKIHTKSFTGFMATIIQHEVDHLEGILFPRRVIEQKGKLYKSYKNEKNQDEFEEIEL